MQAELKVIGGKQQGKVIPLTMKKFLIGREKDCHLRPNNDLISRHHCVLTVDEYTVRVRDLGSTNGTFVNSERIQGQVVLKNGDQLAIGKLLFEIAVRDADSTPTEDVLADAALLETDAFTSRPTPAPHSTIAEIDELGAVADETVSIPAADHAAETPSGVYGGDTVSIPAQPPQQQPPVPQPPQQQPQPSGMMPGMQYPPQGMPQQPFPMPYPQQMPMMPQQYPMMPQHYPQQYPMMPMPVQMAPQPYPQETPAAAPPAEEAEAKAPELDVRLPNPEDTGAKEASNNTGSTAAPAAGASNTTDPRAAAADIIRQYTHRPLGQ